MHIQRTMLTTIAAGLYLMSSLGVAAPPTYDGFSYQGFVIVSDDNLYMNGALNVRTNPSPGHEDSDIAADYNAVDDTVSFYGYDGETGRQFYCFVDSGSTLIDSARLIATTTGHGSYLVIDQVDEECVYISASKSSYDLF